MKKSHYLYKELTPAEVGHTGTHEVYVRLPNNFDYEIFFNHTVAQNGSVWDVNFEAFDITIPSNKEILSLRFVYYINNANKEKRIPSLAPLFKKHNVEEGDIVCLESRDTDGDISYYISFLKKGQIQIVPNCIFFSKIETEDNQRLTSSKNDEVKLLQQIFYGAPGTGKSHTIKKETKGEDVIRTTFHPDSDYSSFVGAYKPTTIEEPVMTVIGTRLVPVENAKPEKKIIYEFVNQAFLLAYVKAWIKYAEAGIEKPKKQFLVIEEINRGNCAQIFGDLFQLLDRNDNGFSDYPINADADMKKQLKSLFEGYDIKDKETINALYDGRDVVSEVLNGDILLLPNNLYIWATMNTSDQSLFPIDSAFKRRWNWQYIPISNSQKGYKIEVNGNYYDWWEFLKTINSIIWETNHSEDKKMGYFFVKSNDTIIKTDVFVGKVIFYLWNDVFKDFIDEALSLFIDSNGTQLSFDAFYDTDITGKTFILDSKVEQFLKNLKLNPCGEVEDNIESDEAEDVASSPNVNGKGQKDKSIYSINGVGKHNKRRTPFEAVSVYVQNNPNMLAQEIVDTWYSLGTIIRHIVITSEEYKEKLSKTSDEALANRYYSLLLKSGETIYVYNQFNPERINDFISKVNAQNWNIQIEKVSE